MTRRRASMTLREFLSDRSALLLRSIPAIALTLVVCTGTNLGGVGGGAGNSEARTSNPALQAPSYAMAVWASEKGLPPGDVFAIAQDVEGYLWLGTPTGLLRFDGNRFSPWEPADPASALPVGPVHALIGSHDGSLWVGIGGGGGIVRLHQGRIVRHVTADGAPPGATAMIQDRQGAIWVAARRGLHSLRCQPLEMSRHVRTDSSPLC
jgi:ligand-binding sensor domain-containing protein